MLRASKYLKHTFFLLLLFLSTAIESGAADFSAPDASKLFTQAKAAFTEGDFNLGRGRYERAVELYETSDSLYKVLIYVRKMAVEQSRRNRCVERIQNSGVPRLEVARSSGCKRVQDSLQLTESESFALSIDVAQLFRDITKMKVHKGRALIWCGELERGARCFETAAGIAREMAPKWGAGQNGEVAARSEEEQVGEVLAKSGADSFDEVEKIKNEEIAVLQAYAAAQTERVRKVSRAHNAVLVMLLVCIVVAGASIYRKWKRITAQKDAQAEEYLASAQAYMEEASSARKANESLVGQLDMQKEQERHLKELLDGRFAEIRSMAGAYYELGFSKALQRRMEAMFESGREGEIFDSLRSVVNARRGNVLDIIAERFPSMSDENMRMLAMLYAGFSAQEISVILNDTASNVYVRKSRLKSKLAEFMKENKDFEF